MPESLFAGFAYNILEENRGPIPELLYHYTTPAGAMGILSNQKLWMSDAIFLNDGAEILHGIRLFSEELWGFMADKPAPEQEIARELLNTLQMQSAYYRTAVFCLSEEGNLLNQWRAYGGEATSYSLEFVTAGLGGDQMNFNGAPGKVIYDETLQRKMLATVIGKIYQSIDALPVEQKGSGNKRDLLMMAVAEISYLIAHFKHPGFSPENEWRFMSFHNIGQPKAPPQFRTNALGIVPYYEWYRADGSDLPINAMMVGPSPYSIASADALRLYLVSLQKRIQVYVSGIPLRR